MTELIKKDLTIDEVNLSHEEALNYFKSFNHFYSASLIESNNINCLKYSNLDKFLTLLFRPLGKSTGVITNFDVRLSSNKNSLLLLFPKNSKPIPKDLKDIETNYTNNQSYAESYSKIINIKCVKIVISNPSKLRELILAMNMHHEKQSSNIAYEISEKVLNGKIK